MNAVVGVTDDGLEIRAEHGLRLMFTALCYHYETGQPVQFQVAVHWQREGERRRPYLVVAIGGHCFQSGWLWGRA
ncbi:MAG: hypothetical protein L0387_00020 [Acidobacteria bacterium]|nr:hypothetical protein [Acidobacteriota bacterium]